MTKEELRKEATMTVEWECTPIIDRPLFVHAYITGAEPREKRIAELEAQIEQNKIDLAIAEHDREHDDYEFTEVYAKVEQLEKENAELKEQCSVLADCNTCHSSCKNENVEMKKQLTKAKEYIKLLLMNCVGVYESTGKTIAEIQIEAEQFLNSEVE